MDCQEIQKSLSYYLEELLSSDEKKLVEGHLSSCVHCRVALAEMQKTKELLGNLDDVEPPPWLTSKIMARVREENEQRASLLKKLFLPFYIKVPIQALTVILVGVVVFQVYRMMEPEMKVTRAPAPPSVLTEKKAVQAPSSPSVSIEQKALKKEAPQAASKSAEALSPNLAKKTSAEKIAAKKDVTTQQGSGAAPVELHKSRNAPEEKSKKEVAGLASPPVQTKAPEPVYERAPEDTGESAVLADKKEAEEKQVAPAPAEAMKEQDALSMQLMPRIIVSAPDAAAAKKSAEDMVKQLGGKQIETISRGATETIIAELPSEKIKELSEKLKTLGEIKTEPELSNLPEGTVRVQIEITHR